MPRSGQLYHQDYVRRGEPRKDSAFARLNGAERRAVIEKALVKIEAHKQAGKVEDVKHLAYYFEKYCEYYAKQDRHRLQRMMEQDQKTIYTANSNGENAFREERIDNNADKISRGITKNMYLLFGKPVEKE